MALHNRTVRFPSHFKIMFNCCRCGHSGPSRLRLKRQHRKKETYEHREPANEPYIFHPLVRTIEPVNQALRLTKTVISEGLPPVVTSATMDFPFDDILLQIKRSVVPADFFDCVEKSKYSQRSKGFMSNVVKAVWSTAGSFPGLLQQAISYRPDLKVHWQRFGYNLQVSGRTGVLFSSSRPLPNFSSPLEVSETEEISVHNKEEILSPVFELSQNSSRPAFKSGFFGDIFPFPRTLIITENNWKLPHLTAQGIMFSFARLAERAISYNKESLGETLKYPLSVRSVVYNENKMAVLCYQLNTLDFENDEGIKNQLWLMPDIPIPMTRLDGANELPVAKFPEDQYKALIAMFLYGENDELTSKIVSDM